MPDDPRLAETEPLDVRRVTTDAEFLQCAQLMAASEPWITLGRDLDSSLRVVTDPTREVYAAFEDDRVRGFIVLCLTGAFVGYIQTVAVQPDERGSGVGSGLIRFAEDLTTQVFDTTGNPGI